MGRVLDFFIGLRPNKKRHMQAKPNFFSQTKINNIECGWQTCEKWQWIWTDYVLNVARIDDNRRRIEGLRSIFHLQNDVLSVIQAWLGNATNAIQLKISLFFLLLLSHPLMLTLDFSFSSFLFVIEITVFRWIDNRWWGIMLCGFSHSAAKLDTCIWWKFDDVSASQLQKPF